MKKGKRSGGSESHVLFSGEAFDFYVIFTYSEAHYVVPIIFAICRLYDEFR